MLTPMYEWEELQFEVHNTAANNFAGIRKIKKQAIENDVREFSMDLNERGKSQVPGIVVFYWQDLDRAFNSAYQDVAETMVHRAMENRMLMSERVRLIADSRSKFDNCWCYEWEDCHIRAFLLARREDVVKSQFRPLNQQRAVLSGVLKAKRAGAIKERMAKKKSLEEGDLDLSL